MITILNQMTESGGDLPWTCSYCGSSTTGGITTCYACSKPQYGY